MKGLKIPVSLVRFRVRAPLFKEPSLWLGFCFSASINPFFSILVSLYRGIVRSAMPGGAALTGPTGFVGRIRRSRHPACFLACKAKNPAPFGTGFFLFDAWQFPTLTWGDPTLPSALRRFTSEFGMGSGGTTALKPPGKFCLICIKAEI